MCLGFLSTAGTTFVQGSPFSSSTCGYAIPSTFWLGLVPPFCSVPTICQGHHDSVTLMAFQGLWGVGATQIQLVFMALDHLVPNCLSNPISHFCPVLTAPCPHPRLCTYLFPTPNAPFSLLSGYCQGLARACLLQEDGSGYTRRMGSPDPSHSLGHLFVIFYNIYCFQCYLNADRYVSGLSN